MEIVAKNIDRLVTIEMKRGNSDARGIIAPLYECACDKLGGRSPSLVAAQRMIEEIGSGDNVFLIAQWATYPNLPFGETDGPLGVASLARAVKLGLGALPIIVTGSRNMEPLCDTTRAAGFNVLEYPAAKETVSTAAASILFPTVDDKDSKEAAIAMLNEYSPKAIIAVETAGPNKKGVKHRGSSGSDMEEKDRLPKLEHLFYEASEKGILTIGLIDRGNEIGSGTIEEDVRRITPVADVCQCPCGGGTACAVKTDIVFPVAVSNWGAYGITAMLAFLLKKPEILQDTYTERRMLEACVAAGALDGPSHESKMTVDDIDYRGQEAIITMLHSIIGHALL